MPESAPLVRARSAEFARVLGAEAVSNFGAMLSRLAIPWLAALGLDATPWQMAGLLLADVATGAVGALGLGTLVDRLDKRRVMLAADVLRAMVLAILAALAWTQHLTMGSLLAAAAASGLLTMAFELARSAWTAQRVVPGDLASGNARLSAAGSLSETAAFALGGWLYQGLGAVAALLVDALSYAISALLLRGVRPAPPEAAPVTADHTAHKLANGTPDVVPESEEAAVGLPMVRQLWQDARQGLVALAIHPTLRALAVVDMLVALSFSIAGTSYMIFVSRDLGFGTGPLGMIFAVGGLGALAGAALAPAAGRRFGAGLAMSGGLALAAIGSACMLLAPGATAWGAMLLVLQQLVGDGGQTPRDVHDRSLRQTAAPAALRARVDAGIRTLSQSATLLGAVLGGSLATAMGARGALLGSTICLAAAALWAALKIPPADPAGDPVSDERASPPAR